MIVLVSLLCSCGEDADNIKTFHGRWKIDFRYQNEVRTGQISFFNDQTGMFSIAKDSTSQLLPQSAMFDFVWLRENDQLIIQRMDSQFQLIYDIVSESDGGRRLVYLNDIHIDLSR